MHNIWCIIAISYNFVNGTSLVLILLLVVGQMSTISSFQVLVILILIRISTLIASTIVDECAFPG